MRCYSANVVIHELSGRMTWKRSPSEKFSVYFWPHFIPASASEVTTSRSYINQFIIIIIIIIIIEDINNRVLSDSDFSNMNVIRELLYIKHNFADMTLYSKDEIDFILEYCCTS